MIIRTRYSKGDEVRYISHLEVMNTLRYSFRRANLPVSFSGGYNPRIKLAMGQPLAVGMTGTGEYFDLELRVGIKPRVYKERVNQCLPGGITLLAAREIPSGVKSLQAVVNTAIYRMNMEFTGGIVGENDEKKIITDFLHKKYIKLERFRRNKENRIIDLRPLIYGIEIYKQGVWDFTVSTGSQGNVRPSELIRALAENYEMISEIPLIRVVRVGLFVTRNGNLYSPFAKKIVGS